MASGETSSDPGSAEKPPTSATTRLDTNASAEARNERENGSRIKLRFGDGTHVEYDGSKRESETRQLNSRGTLVLSLVGASAIALVISFAGADNPKHSASQETNQTPKAAAAVALPEPDECCRTCKAGQACGDACIPKGSVCHEPPGCACQAPREPQSRN